MTRTTLSTILCAALYAMAAYAQNPATVLTITAPSNGVVVHPGDSLQVTVTSQASKLAPIREVMLAAQGLGYTVLQTAPFQFNLQIPSTAVPGPCSLQALGATALSNGVAAISQPITLNIQSLAAPVGMVVEPASIEFTIYPGMNLAQSQQPLQAWFLYADGTRSLIAAGPGSQLNFSATGGLSVDNTGLVTASSAGSGQITVQCVDCPGVTKAVTVSVWVELQPIYVSVGSYQVSAAGGDLNINVVTSGASYSVAGETWMGGILSLTLDHSNWTTSVTIAPNTSTAPRVGTLHFSLTSGASQDAVVYQAATP